MESWWELKKSLKKPKSNFAVTGMYLYDNSVFDRIKQIKPSKRNELEITDVNNLYIDESLMSYEFLTDEWTDAGTFESLFKANQIARNCMMEEK
jgi:glucose-1-phosphate thymidylyltransferase